MGMTTGNPNLGPVRAHMATLRNGGSPARFIGSPSFHGWVFLTLVWFAIASLGSVLFTSRLVDLAMATAWLLASATTWWVQRKHWKLLRREYLATLAPAGGDNA